MNIFELPVHPAADVFPMLDNDELSDLAADIKANGLQHPVVVGVVDGVEMLIDGRNRLAACKLAKVEPEVKQLNGRDPAALILSENIMRRHMTKGQRAMAVAMMYPEGHWKKLVKNTTLSTEYVTKARTVLKHSTDLARRVIAGSPPLGAAYDEAVAAERKAAADAEKLAWLKKEHSELADEVIENGADIDEQVARGQHRDSVAAEELTKDDVEIKNACEALSSGFYAVSALSAGKGLEKLLGFNEDGKAQGLLRNYFRNGVEDIIEDREKFLAGVERIVKFMEDINE